MNATIRYDHHVLTMGDTNLTCLTGNCLKPRSVISDDEEDAGSTCKHRSHAEDYHQPSKSRKENSTRNRACLRSHTLTSTRQRNPILSVNAVSLSPIGRHGASIDRHSHLRERGRGSYVFRPPKLQV